MERDFTFYNPETGLITSYYRGDQATADLNGPNVPGKWPRDDYMIVNGIVVERPDRDEAQSETARHRLRSARDSLLAKSDWTQVPDAPLTETQKAEWRIYRQKLRDLPANTEDPRNVIWPTKPSG